MPMKRLAMIGSRETPPRILWLATEVGKLCVENGVIATSGHAKGFDYAAEQGAGKNCAVYLPFKDYNWFLPMLGRPCIISSDNKPLDDLIDKHHPAPHNLNDWSRSQMRRNGAQILGENLTAPVDAVICWTNPKKGGTTQAIRIAESHGIPVLNLWCWTEDQIEAADAPIMAWQTLESLVAAREASNG